MAAFLTHLATNDKVSPSTQNQAASSLLFLYREVLRMPIDVPHGVVRPGRTAPARVPVVLTRVEVQKVLEQLQGTHLLVCRLLYSSGLRLLEALQLRVKDVLLERREVVVRAEKGGGDRVTMLPAALVDPITRHLGMTARQHARDADQKRGWSRCRGAWRRSILMQAATSPGSTSSRPRGITRTWQLASSAAIICTSPPCGER